MHILRLSTLSVFVLLVCCTKDHGADPDRRPDTSYNPQLNPLEFPASSQWTNVFAHVNPVKTYVYEGLTEDGEEHIEIRKDPDFKMISGITCGILVEKSWIEHQLVESVKEYYAEDVMGNLWLMGTDVDNFNSSGALINHHGSWEDGMDGARAGIAMLGDPQLGRKYRQEYYFNIAENQAEVVQKGITVSTKMATFYDCIVIREWSELEPDILDYKMYAPGVGLVKEVNISTGDIIELVDIR